MLLVVLCSIGWRPTLRTEPAAGSLKPTTVKQLVLAQDIILTHFDMTGRTGMTQSFDHVERKLFKDSLSFFSFHLNADQPEFQSAAESQSHSFKL